MARFFVFLVFFSNPVFAEENINGKWVGIGHQSGETWQISVTIVDGGARVDYPDFPCGGIWVLNSAAGMKGTEHLTYGKEHCWDGLLVQLSKLEGNKLRAIWLDGATRIAHAELEHVPHQKLSDGKKN